MESTEVTLHRLPANTIKLLSSGQVITSVSTAVKELVENAIDAGATNIEIRLEKEGLDKIDVKDNGDGVKREDVPFMCQRMYTSKIKDFDDLVNVTSYGFRGEALNSLCAISQLSVTTKTFDDEAATCYIFNSQGEVTSSHVAQLNKGTLITVRDIFKNLPVRKQYFTRDKKKTKELKAIEDIVKSFGLIHPRLRIVLSHNNFQIWQKVAVNSLRETLVQIVFASITKHLHEINYTDDKVKIHLFVPLKTCHVWNTCYGVNIHATNVFVNRRPVKDKQIEKAIQEELHQFFGSAIPKNKNPFCLISLTVPTQNVDINLEPNKTRVLIKDLDYIIRVLKHQLILYYVGALEPPKSSTDENIVETQLKRKSVERTPVKAKIAKKVDSCNKKEYPSEENTDLTVEKNIPVTISKIDFNEEINDSMVDDSFNLNLSKNNSPPKVMEADSSLNLEDSFTEYLQAYGKNSNEMNVTLGSDKDKSTMEENPVGIMSEDDESNFFLPEDLLQIVDNNCKVSNGDCTEFVSSHMTDVECNKSELNSSNQLPQLEININEITPSQWSRGDVQLNDQVIESSTVIVNQDEARKQVKVNTFSSINEPSASSQGNRSVSSQMGLQQLSAFTKFAREMRSKITQQKPGITFTEVASELASKWRNLQDEDKDKYANMAKEKEKNITKVPIKKISDPSYKPKHFGIRYNPKDVSRKERKYHKEIHIDISIDKLKSELDKRIQNKAPGINLISTLEENILVFDKGKVNIVCIERLKEAVALHNNLEQMVIPQRPLDVRIPILHSDIEPELWDLLESFDTSFDNAAAILSNERIIKNGLRIEKISGGEENKYFLTNVPANTCGLDVLKEILQFIRINKDVKLCESRPLPILNFIKNETLKEKAYQDHFKSSNNTNTLDIYQHWTSVNGNTRNCPHYRPIYKTLYPVE